MNLVVLKLRFAGAYQFSNAIFDVLMVVNLKILTLICSNFSVKTHQQWFENTFSSLKIEIHDPHPVNERNKRAFDYPM